MSTATPARWRGTPTAAAASVAIHAGLLALTGVIVYRTAIVRPERVERIVIDFAAPGTTADALAAPAEGEAGAAPAPSLRKQRGASPAALLNDDALTPPALRGLSDTPAGSPPEPIADSAAVRERGLLAGASDAFAGPLDDLSGNGPVEAPRGVTFAGLGASSARSVVYAIDCSGSMVTSLPLVIAEVRRSVQRLSPTQKFGVVLFGSTGGAPVVRAFAPVLVRATPSALARLSDWLSEAQPEGRSSPLIGIEAALNFKPDAVFVLSRAIERSGGVSGELGFAATLERLEEINPAMGDGRRPVLIQTIQFLDEDPSGVLRAIGSRHGGGSGGYRVVASPDQLAN